VQAARVGGRVAGLSGVKQRRQRLRVGHGGPKVAATNLHGAALHGGNGVGDEGCHRGWVEAKQWNPAITTIAAAAAITIVTPTISGTGLAIHMHHDGHAGSVLRRRGAHQGGMQGGGAAGDGTISAAHGDNRSRCQVDAG